MRRLIRSRLIWISTVCKRVSDLPDVQIYPTLPYIIGHRLPLTGVLQGGIFDELNALFVFLDYVCQTFRCIEFLQSIMLTQNVILLASEDVDIEAPA